MAEWLIEEGIGEDRAILLEGGEIAAARLHWPGGLAFGQVDDALLVSRNKPSLIDNIGIVRFPNGQEAFAKRVPREATEGMKVRMEVWREAISERGRLKLAQAMRSEKEIAPAPSLAERLAQEGHTARIVHRFPAEAGWEDLFQEAWAGEVGYSGGSLLLSDTPAMTLIDVDADSPESAYYNAPAAIARTLRRLEIGGNIGVDFLSVSDKADRKAIDRRLAESLEGWPHERTAMTGFGFIQIVTKLRHPSIFQRIHRDRAGAAARLMLRRAERVEQPGALQLTCHPALQARLSPEWLNELARRSGREIRVETRPTLAIEAGFAQAVAL